MKKILVADTIKEHLQEEHSVLSRSDILVLSAASAENMLDIHRSERVDLIITDLEIPVMGGDKLCTAIRADHGLKDVSIILACPNDKEVLEWCGSCGANSLIIKPIYHRDLVSKASALLKIPERESLRVLINITVQGQHREDFYCSTKNISTSGMLFETRKVLAIGERVTLSLLLSLKRVTVAGEVVRVKQIAANHYQYGIHFIDVDERSKALINDFVRIRRAF
ncbi:MAG: PilZ domain-containing protein [bacterium]